MVGDDSSNNNYKNCDSWTQKERKKERKRERKCELINE